MLQSMRLRAMKLWVVVLVLNLSGVPAWACPSRHGSGAGKQKAERATSIQLTTKRAELSFLSQRLVDGPLEKKDKKLDEAHEGRAERGLRTQHHGASRRAEIRHEWNGQGRGHGHVRGQPSRLTPPSIAGASPIPEPSSLMFFGVGLLLARRAIGVKRSA